MYKSQKGFTLIELVVVIVLLGILGVTALAKFQDLSGDAQTAANQGIASELSSGSSINYAARVLNSGNGTAVTGTVDCDDLVDGTGTSLLSVPLDLTKYTLTVNGACGATSGNTIQCLIDDANTIGAQATASIVCIP